LEGLELWGDRQIEAAADLRSATDLVGALRKLGHAARVLAADDDVDLALRSADIDACLLALHGRRGGTGEVQALLGVRQIPYCGPGAAAVSLAFDKVRSRQMLAYHNVPVLPAVTLGRNLEASDRALALLGWPCVVKPRRGAHGLGVTHLQSTDTVKAAIERALAVDEDIVLERAVAGTEVQVVLLGDRVLGAVEVVGRDATSPGDIVCPPRLSRSRLDGIRNIARRSVAALGLYDGLSRVDMLVSDRHNEVVLEVEPLPSLARDGVVARVALAAGMPYEELISELLDRIVLRVPERRMSTASLMLQ
jgi:D-alanine-D-alanine ligase